MNELHKATDKRLTYQSTASEAFLLATVVKRIFIQAKKVLKLLGEMKKTLYLHPDSQKIVLHKGLLLLKGIIK